MKDSGNPVPVDENPKPVITSTENTNTVSTEKDGDYYDQRDIVNEELQELQNFLYGRSVCRKHDVLFLMVFFGVFTIIWVFIYRLPIPDVVKTIFGMDDTQYPPEHK